MGNIAEVLIIIFIIGINLFLGAKKKIKRGDKAEDEEVDSQASRMAALRERVRAIRGDAYWQQFRERIVPPEPPMYEDEEEYQVIPGIDIDAEEEPDIYPPITETVEEIVAEDKIERIEEAEEPVSYIFNLGQTELQRGIVLAEILSPCLAKRKSSIRRI